MRVSRHWPFFAAGLFALVWSILRANLQSVTLDEADSYLGYIAPQNWPAYWYPSSGNHVLNSILSRLIIAVFGLSHLTLRAPALLGAAIYIYAGARLCGLVTPSNWIRLPLFLALIYNPMVMDYMVAARGYSLALGLLLTAIWLLGRNLVEREASQRRRIAASFCIGLSFCANFSFAWVDLACLAVYFGMSERKRGRAAAELLIPAAVVTLLLCGSVLADWPRGQLYFGAHSLLETWRSIIAGSFPALNQFMVNRVVSLPLEPLPGLVPSIAVLIFLAQAFFLRRSFGEPRMRLAVYIFIVAASALLLHWLQFRVFRIPLPLERTALFLVVLPLLTFGAVTAASSPLLRRAGSFVLTATALYFMGSLRTNYFQEWRFGADVRAAFPVLQDLSKRYNVHEFPTAWEYSSSFNFYRAYAHENGIAEFRFINPLPPDKPFYVLPYSSHAVFIHEHKLQIIYRGETTELVIAAQPSK